MTDGPWATIERCAAPMRDGVRLVADLYRPPDRRVPTLLVRTPYGRGLAERIEDVDPLRAVQDGFAVVIQEVRGRGESEGEFRPNWSDAQDGADTVAWIRRQRWSDGRVGMAGASYNGLVQLQAAQQRPEGLVAIAPAAIGALRSVCFPGGAPRLVLLGGWWLTSLLTDALAGNPAKHVRAEIAELLDASVLERFHALLRPGSVMWEVGAPIRPWIQAPAPDRLWTEVTAVPADPLPAIFTSGWYDVCAPATLDAYADWSAVADGRAPQRLTLGPWSHDLRQPAYCLDLGLTLENSPPAGVALERQLAFMKAMLGDGVLDELAPVTSFVLGRNRWHEGAEWPPRDVRPIALTLAVDAAGDGCLVRDPASGTPAPVRFRYDPRDPVPTLGGASALWDRAGALDLSRIEARADVVTFTSVALAGELELAGRATVRLVLRSSAPATDFIARLTLVLPGGRSLALAEGNWSGRLAELPQATVSPTHRLCELVLGPTHVVIAPGVRLRLQVTSSSYPDLYPNPNTGHDLADGPPPAVRTAEQELLVGGAGGSLLTLPLRGAPPRHLTP